MKLIQKTGSKPESSNSTKTKQFGLFECPVCLEHVEKPLSHGRRNKNCGKKECRKATLTPAYNLTGKKEDTIWDKPYYTNICSIYNKVKKQYEIDSAINSQKEFVKLFYEDYSKLRETKTANYITVITSDNSTKLSIDNVLLVHSDDDYIEERKFTGKYEYCCRKLMRELNCTYAVAVGTIKKLTNAYKEDTIYTRQKRKLKTLIVDYDTYIKAKHVIENNSSIKQPTKVYIITSGKFVKIGITNNIEKRLSSINAMNPFGAELNCFYDFGERAYEVEQYLHNKYKKNKHNFEWFILDNSQIEDIKNELSTNILECIDCINKNKKVMKIKKIQSNNKLKSRLRANAIEEQKRKSREANKKPVIETVHEWDERFEHDRTNQIEACTTHGMSKTPLYKAWQTMKKIYKVCDEWQKFEPFKEAVELEYSKYTEEDTARIYPVKAGTIIGPDNYMIKPKAEHEVKSAVARAVQQLDKDGIVIGEYKTVTEAAKAVNGIASKISAVCKGARKSHAGYNWAYKD